MERSGNRMSHDRGWHVSMMSQVSKEVRRVRNRNSCSLLLLFSLLELEPLLGVSHFLTSRMLGFLVPSFLFPDLGSCSFTLGFQPLPFGCMLCSRAHIDFVRKVQNFLPVVVQPHPPNRGSRI